MRVAFVHDWLNGMRGGERVLETLCREFPEAPIHTLIHEPGRVSPTINSHSIHTSWFQTSPWARRHYRWLLPLMTRAVAALRPRDADLVVSLSHCVAKGVSVPEGTPHLCYCFSPMRYIWDQTDQYIGSHTGRRWLAPAVALLRPGLRRWDVRTAQRVTAFIAISQHIASKIRRFYGREARVIHPPVDTEFFTPGEGDLGDHFLIVSAMVPYKRVDLAIRAATLAGFRLRIVGDGPERFSLARLSRGHPNIEFAGWLSDAALRQEYRRCRALIFPGEEDFGLVPLEANACGRPVIALRAGGVPESVVEGETGVFFDDQTPEAVVQAVHGLETRPWDSARCVARAAEFSTARFLRQMHRVMEETVSSVPTDGCR